METRHLGGPAAVCVGLAVIVSEWRGWLNLDHYQILPPWDCALGRGTDGNSLAEKAQSNPVRRSILRRGSISLKYWESLTVVVWRFLRLLIYLNSPSVMKIPDLKKLSRKKKKPKGFARIRVFCRDQIKFFQCVSSIHRPSLAVCTGDNHATLTASLLARFTEQETNSEISTWTNSWGGEKILPLISRRQALYQHIPSGCPTTMRSQCTYKGNPYGKGLSISPLSHSPLLPQQNHTSRLLSSLQRRRRGHRNIFWCTRQDASLVCHHLLSPGP